MNPTGGRSTDEPYTSGTSSSQKEETGLRVRRIGMRKRRRACEKVERARGRKEALRSFGVVSRSLRLSHRAPRHDERNRALFGALEDTPRIEKGSTERSEGRKRIGGAFFGSQPWSRGFSMNAGGRCVGTMERARIFGLGRTTSLATALTKSEVCRKRITTIFGWWKLLECMPATSGASSSLISPLARSIGSNAAVRMCGGWTSQQSKRNDSPRVGPNARARRKTDGVGSRSQSEPRAREEATSRHSDGAPRTPQAAKSSFLASSGDKLKAEALTSTAPSVRDWKLWSPGKRY